MSNKGLIDTQIAYLRKKIELANFSISESQVNQFEKYLAKLIQWNKRINLISKNDEKNIAARHFLESIAILEAINFPNHSYVIDVGTGAGFPGLPLKIIRQDLNLILLDSKRFKTLFLNDVLNTLKLANVEVVRDRAEAACLSPKFNRQFDFVLARSVARLSKLYEWTSQFLKPKASILAIKGGEFTDEIEEIFKKYQLRDLRILPLKSKLIEEDRNIAIIQISVVT